MSMYLADEERYYLLRIRLLEIQPEIWRRFYVPGIISLDRLHDVIQIVMGWEDYHLHEFVIGKHRYTEFPESKEDGKEDYRYRLIDLIKQKGRTFTYTYDFGDDWVHELQIVDSRYEPEDPRMIIRCNGGARACPPEDAGGPFGYMRYLEILSDPDHPEHRENIEWRGQYDGESFSLETVNQELLKYLRWSRDRVYSWRQLILKGMAYRGF